MNAIPERFAECHDSSQVRFGERHPCNDTLRNIDRLLARAREPTEDTTHRPLEGAPPSAPSTGVGMPTYAAPGVYVEEVPSSQKVLVRGADRHRRVRRVHREGPDRRPERPGRPGAPPGHQLDPVREAVRRLHSRAPILPLSVYGYFANGGALAYIVRVPNTAPSGQPSRQELPAADRALGLPIAVESLEPDADLSVQVSTAETRRGRARARSTSDVLSERRSSVESFENLTLGKGDRNVATVVNETSTKVKVEVAAGRQDRPVQPDRGAQAGHLRAGEGRPRHRLPSPAASSPARSRRVRASTAWPSPTTSRSWWCPT